MQLLQRALSAALTLSTLALGVHAGGQEAGSLLLFPCFDSVRPANTVITVTNTNTDTTPVGALQAGTVDVEFVYINMADCQEFNRTRRLTPNDEITVVARLDNPNQVRGYLYVFAKNPLSGQAISWNWLIGTSNVNTPFQGFGVNPFVFKAMPNQGLTTELNGDGLRNLNGTEYEAAPNRILVPRFSAQEGVPFAAAQLPLPQSYLILVNLTGAAQFTAVVDFLIYNDNEEVFSAQYAFRCYAKVPLYTVSGAFNQAFLASTAHAQSESIFGYETGWFRMNGNVAFSTADSEPDPAILGFLVEGAAEFGVTAELPFTSGTQTNAELLSHSVVH